MLYQITNEKGKWYISRQVGGGHPEWFVQFDLESDAQAFLDKLNRQEPLPNLKFIGYHFVTGTPFFKVL